MITGQAMVPSAEQFELYIGRDHSCFQFRPIQAKSRPQDVWHIQRNICTGCEHKSRSRVQEEGHFAALQDIRYRSRISALHVSSTTALSSNLPHWYCIPLFSDEIDVNWFDSYILIDYQSEIFGVHFVENRIRMIFDNYPGRTRFKPADDCELVCKIASCISTVVADYILRCASEVDLRHIMEMSLIMLQCKCSIDRPYSR